MGKKELPVGYIDMKKVSKYLEKEWSGSIKARQIPKVWDKKFHNKTAKEHRISICTTCMDRLHDLKVTLPKNIEDNSDYENLEFVILDYNSKDGVEDWVREELMEYIESGLVVYYRTDEPYYYDMSHSRNIAFKVATGDIVNNVDADAYTRKGFASFVNRLANEQPEKAIFAKGKRMLRGRLGFYRREFIDELGGYDEELTGYGHDDRDLMHRAWELGYRMMYYGGRFAELVEGHRKRGGKETANNYAEIWWLTEGRNRMISFTNLIAGKLKANEGKHWGKAHLVKNFEEELDV